MTDRPESDADNATTHSTNLALINILCCADLDNFMMFKLNLLSLNLEKLKCAVLLLVSLSYLRVCATKLENGGADRCVSALTEVEGEGRLVRCK